ncbi:uncharacterized protein METZ01_LOCUS397607, partial [marine metagenome]
LDQFSESIESQMHSVMPIEQLVSLVNIELFQNQGFRGNKVDYYNPDNSYLSRVFDQRLGIPITLSVIYMEVAQRIGLECDGIGYPAHFLIRCGGEESDLYVDVFNEGKLLSRPDLFLQLKEQGFVSDSGESFIAAVTRRQILQRILTNLRIALRRINDFNCWLLVTELQLILEPWNSSLFLERGMVHFTNKKFKNSLKDLRQYLEIEPDNSNEDVLRIIKVLEKYQDD